MKMWGNLSNQKFAECLHDFEGHSMHFNKHSSVYCIEKKKGFPEEISLFNSEKIKCFYLQPEMSNKCEFSP